MERSTRRRLVDRPDEPDVRYYFGTVGSINAFEVAFLVPNTIRALVADAALSSAFVPVFSELLEKGERKRAWRVASSLLWLMLLGLGALTALFILLAPWVMRPFGYHGADDVGTVIQVLLPLPWLFGKDGRLHLAIDVRDPAVKRTFVLMFPVTLGIGLINFNLLVDTFFAARLIDPQLAPNAPAAALRIYMLPQGLL